MNRPIPFEPELISYDNAVQAEYDSMHETKADRLFIASGEQMLKQCPPKRVFSFKVLGMFILAFALVMWIAYLGLNGEGW